MDIQPYALWLIAALALAGVEMLIGTFYLLVWGIGCAAAGVAAYFGADLPLQLVLGSAIGLAGTFWLRRHPLTRRPRGEADSLEIGQPVTVEHWQSAQRARVRYRGAGWDAELTGETDVQPQQLYIVGQRGNVLLVAPHPPTPHT
ncbi:NfeD family protein [Chitinimonas lacunae]|uniref:NfeD family protein n=1 Tax=Chitinimonas lacunae TaxID=1963018 RepID=A0ABV8MQG5_9NEIS